MGVTGPGPGVRGGPVEGPARRVRLAVAGLGRWLEPLGDPSAERRRDGRLAAFLALIAALYIALTVPELPGHRVALLVILALIAVVIVVFLVMPWPDLPEGALSVPIVLGLAILSLGPGALLGDLGHYVPLYGLGLGYCGLVLGPKRTAEMTLGALLGLAVALLGNQDQDVPEVAGAIVVFGLLGVLMAASVGAQRRHRADLERLHEGVLGLLAADDQDEAAQLVGRLAGDLLHADGVGVVIRDHPSSPIMINRGGYGLAARLAGARVDVNAEQSGTGVAARSGESLFIPDALNSPLLARRYAEALQAASVLYLPLVGRLEVLGVIVIWWSSPMTSLDGFAQQVVRLLSIQAAPVLERVRKLEDLDQATVTDPLTGIGNRRAFERALVDLTPDAALIMCDLNRFKELNDTLGHPAGDQVLRIFAATAATAIRGGDLVARVGGDEFALVITGGGAAAALVLERLRSAWKDPDGVGFSAGLAARHPGETGEELAARADQELYAAKRASRVARAQA